MAVVLFDENDKDDRGEIAVAGWVVNVHDAINFDIDLSLNHRQKRKYRHVITNDYEYREKSSGEDNKVGKTYRCRLKGIQLSSYRSSRGCSNALERATRDMKQMIDRCDGWVVCVIGGIDVYNRLLVDLIDPALFPIYYKSYSSMLFDRHPKIFTKYKPHLHNNNNKSTTSHSRKKRSVHRIY